MYYRGETLRRRRTLAVVGLLVFVALTSGCSPTDARETPPTPSATFTPSATALVEPTKLLSQNLQNKIPTVSENIKKIPEYKQLIEGSTYIPADIDLMIQQGAPLSKNEVNSQLDFRTFVFKDTMRATWTFFHQENGKITHYALNPEAKLITTEIPKPEEIPKEYPYAKEYENDKPMIIPVFNLQGGRKRLLVSEDWQTIYGVVDEQTGKIKLANKTLNLAPYQKSQSIYVVDIMRITENIPAVDPTPNQTK